MAWTCGTCWRGFSTARAREQHMYALDHSIPQHECDRCSSYFGTRSAVVNHMNTKNHWHYECSICNETWPTIEQRTDHEISDHYYCADCERLFNSYNNIKMHLNSRVHRGKNLACPFCKQNYTTATGLAHHLERGACPKAPFLDQDEVYRLVRRKDPSGLFSKNLIGWEGSEKYKATALAWNGRAYECFICHRQFSQLHSLDQHVSSPTHQQNLYHCPKRNTCGREFTTLAALMSHLESESCGYTKFENVQRATRSIMSGDRLITFN
ncbi:hypothetical protein F4819DRAFT_473284 [Hypoxylon fuscum]|nr:hypothetical protein F4819DRAFT_473284 [Hypoxylon fuscum]